MSTTAKWQYLSLSRNTQKQVSGQGIKHQTKKVEAMTKEGVEEEERRERLTDSERMQEDSDNTAAKPGKEVEEAMKLPPPLVYTPPLESEDVINERAREQETKSNIKLARDKAKAQEKSEKMISRAEEAGGGVEMGTRPGQRPINENGRFCTPSKQTGCVKVDPLFDKIQCNTDVQLCQFESPTTPGKFEITEPQIPCPTGREECVVGVADVEAEYWQQAHKEKVVKEWIKSSAIAKTEDAVREQTHAAIKADAAKQQELQKAEIDDQMMRVQLEENRPSGGVFEPLPQLDSQDEVTKVREQSIKMRQKLGQVNTIAKKLGILTLGCQEINSRCHKRCASDRKSVRKDPDGTKCLASCDKGMKYCMLAKVKKAQFAANIAASNQNIRVSRQELGESSGTTIRKESKLPDLTKEKLAQLAKDPHLSGMATACDDGMPGSCDQLKTELNKQREKMKDDAKKTQEEPELVKTAVKGVAKPIAKANQTGTKTVVPSNKTAATLAPAKSATKSATPNRTATANKTAVMAKPVTTAPTSTNQTPPTLPVLDPVKVAIDLQAKKEAKQIAKAMEKEYHQETKEAHEKKSEMKKDLKATQEKCEKEAVPGCDEEAAEYRKENTNKDDDTDAKKDLEDEVEKTKVKCMKDARWECRKKTLAHMTEKYNQAVSKLIKVKKDLHPWLKKQAAEKKKKESEKFGAIEIKEKAEEEAKRIVATGATVAAEMNKGTAGCKNDWRDDHCQSISEHCSGHPALRFKCRLTCAACGESFNFVTPDDGRDIAFKQGYVSAKAKKPKSDINEDTVVHNLSP